MTMKSNKKKSIQARKKDLVYDKLEKLCLQENGFLHIPNPKDFDLLYQQVPSALIKKLNSTELANYIFLHVYKPNLKKFKKEATYKNIEPIVMGGIINLLV